MAAASTHALIRISASGPIAGGRPAPRRRQAALRAGRVTLRWPRERGALRRTAPEREAQPDPCPEPFPVRLVPDQRPRSGLPADARSLRRPRLRGDAPADPGATGRARVA